MSPLTLIRRATRWCENAYQVIQLDDSEENTTIVLDYLKQAEENIAKAILEVKKKNETDAYRTPTVQALYTNT